MVNKQAPVGSIGAHHSTRKLTGTDHFPTVRLPDDQDTHSHGFLAKHCHQHVRVVNHLTIKLPWLPLENADNPWSTFRYVPMII